MQIFRDVVRQLSAERQNYTIRLLKVIYFHHRLQKPKKTSLIHKPVRVTTKTVKCLHVAMS